MKTLSNSFGQRLTVSVVIASLFFGLFSVSNAQTTAPLTNSQTQFAQLQAQLYSLQQQLSTYTTGPNALNSVTTSNSVEVGDRIQTTANVNVRSTPSMYGTKLAVMPALSEGTVIGGPSNMVNGIIVVQPIAAKNSTYWQIQYDNGVTGWTGTLWVRDVSSDYGSLPAGTTPVTCDSFVFTPASVYRGASTTATWNNSNGGRVFLMNSRGDFNREFLSGEKSYTFVPTQTGLYTLKVIGANNTQATCVATISVRGASSPIIGTSTTTAPACDYFKFTPSNVKKGATATLSWKASGVTSVSIASSQDQVRVVKPLEGSLSLTASGTVMYTLFGYSATGQERPLCTATLVVQAVTSTATTPICNAFYFTPSPAIRNATTTATWETTNANRVILSTVLGGNIKSSSVVDGSHSFVVKKISEMYTLTAVGADGTRNSCNFLLNAS